MNAITDETCEYGLARTRDGCVRTFASFASLNYERLQIVSVALGLFALCVSSYKYVRSVRNHGAKLQQRAFLLSMYASVTFVVRGVDPMGYAHYIPRPVGHFIVDSCTAAIFTVFIMTLSFWVSIIHKGTPTPERTASRIKLLEYSSIAVIWLSKVAVNVSLVWSKGYDVTFSMVELFATAALLFGLCITFAVYGLRVIRRLEYIDKMTARRLSMATHYDTLYTSRVDRLAVSHASTVMSYTDLESQHQDSVLPPVLEAKATTIPPLIKCKKRKPARKIKEMLVITECVSFLCIAAQIYTGVQRSNGYKELRCANGFECERLSAHWPLLHGFQYVTIWCVLFTFRKTKRDRNAANALGLTQRVGLP